MKHYDSFVCAQHERAAYENKVRIPWRSGSVNHVSLTSLEAGMLASLTKYQPELGLLPDFMHHVWQTDRHQTRPISALAGTYMGAMHMGRVSTPGWNMHCCAPSSGVRERCPAIHMLCAAMKLLPQKHTMLARLLTPKPHSWQPYTTVTRLYPAH